MPDKLTYLLIDIGAFIIPFIFSFHPKIQFYKEWKAFWLSNLIITVLFIAWDVLYTHLGVWGFNERYITGFKIFNLPIEEVLFFVCIPYASMFTYHCFKLFFSKIYSFQFGFIGFVLIVLLLAFAILNFSKIYTSVTFIALALLLSNCFLYSLEWLRTFFLMYLVILIPFFIVNGLLTGTGLDEPVVWYDNSENLSVRVLTIPVEDFFYGMLLLLLNTYTFESFKRKNAKKTNPDLSF
ncbi:MAG: lycopene cyclase domain-containing protein [Bacteroidia bacterium]|nr:lycopene cyclase domain-containing protein [Bacteroidia bacterium]